MFLTPEEEDIFNESEISLEEDIVDQLRAADIDEEMPARPSSRLGFNRLEYGDDTPLAKVEFSERMHLESTRDVKTLRSSSAKPDEDEDDIATFVSERDITSKSVESRSYHTGDALGSLNELDDMSPYEGSEFDADSENYSSCEESEDESETTSLIPAFSPPAEEADWSLCPKFSCLPSPLSSQYTPFSISSYRHTPQRHRYRQHGHSRHALHHLKWFWSMREETWIEYKARICEAKAYDGLSIFSSVSPGLCLPGGCISPPLPADTPTPPPPPPIACLPPLSIHPRRGDLSALHDPYCMHIDRYFVGMPLWTMAKTLWMFDVHMASGGFRGEQHELDDDLFDEVRSNESIETSDSNAFSDDSDSTLVENESDADLPRCTSSTNLEQPEDEPKGYLASNHETDPSSSNIPNVEGSESFRPISTSSKAFSFSGRWATNWYRRWEVLLQLCIENPTLVEPDLSPAAPSPPKSQRFFLGDDWSDIMEEDEEEQDTEEMTTGNVLVVVNDEASNGRSLRHWF